MASQSGKTSKTDESKILKEILEEALAGNLRRVKKLIKDLNNVNDITHIKDSDGRSLLHAVALKGRTNVCKYLLEDLQLHIDGKDEGGYTALLHASSEGNLSTVKYLIENGADPAASSKHNTTALHLAAIDGNIEVIEFLISKGANVNAPSAIGTPLQLAAQLGNLNVLQILLDNRAEPNPISLVPTPLSFCMSHSLECTKLLIQAGADLNGSSCGMTPLASAAKTGDIEHLDYLLVAGADANIVTDIGLKPLEIAALNGKRREVEKLFPSTSPIATCSDWSVPGIMKHVNSEEFEEQVKLRLKEKHSEAISHGDAAFNRRDYMGAAFYYTQAIVSDPSDATVLLKRGQCFTDLGNGEKGWADAEACIALRPDWPEAYYRGGVAVSQMGDFDMAQKIFYEGLRLHPGHKDLQIGYDMMTTFKAFGYHKENLPNF